MSDDKSLGAYDGDMDGGEIGELDLFGLDEFGNPAGSRELWGAVLGSAVSTGVAIAARAFGKDGGKIQKHSELIGLGAGVAASGAMMISPGTRAAGWTCLATALVGNGLRVMEQIFTKTPSAAAVEGWGAVTAEQINGNFGAVTAEQINGYNGYDGVVAEQVAGAQFSDTPPVDILSEGSLPESSQHVSIMGGPAMSGLGVHYGSTLFGGD